MSVADLIALARKLLLEYLLGGLVLGLLECLRFRVRIDEDCIEFFITIDFAAA